MKKILSLLMLGLMLIPNVSLAVWWNPFTWFQKEKVEPHNIVTKDSAWLRELNAVMSSPTTTPEQVKPSVTPSQTVKPTPEVVPVVKVEAQASMEQVNKLQEILYRDSETYKFIHNDINTIYETIQEDLAKFAYSESFESVIEASNELKTKAESQQEFLREMLAQISEMYNTLKLYQEGKVTLSEEEFSVFTKFYVMKRNQYKENEESIKLSMEDYYKVQANIIKQENTELQKELDEKRILLKQMGITD